MPKVHDETSAFYRQCGFEQCDCRLCAQPIFMETRYERRGVCSDCTMALVNDYALQHSGAPDPRIDPDGYRALSAHLRNNWKPVSEADRWVVFERDGYRCRVCKIKSSLTIDHIHPRSAGGTDDLSNLQTLCRSCNSRKGASA